MSLLCMTAVLKCLTEFQRDNRRKKFMANYCHNCGAKLKANAKFCTVCGTKVFSENNSASVTLEKKSPSTSGESIQERYLKMKAQVEKKSVPMTVQEIMENAKKISQATSSTAKSQPVAQTSSSYNPQPSPQQNYNPLGTVQPYTPDEDFHDLFLKSEGRLNRLRFFKRSMLASLIASIPLFLILATDSTVIYHETSTKMIVVQLVMIFINACLHYNLIIRRCHDLSSTSWWAKQIAQSDSVLANVYVGFAVISAIATMANTSHDPGVACQGGLLLYLLFAKGEVGPNKYGSDPLGNFR